MIAALAFAVGAVVALIKAYATLRAERDELERENWRLHAELERGREETRE